MAEAVYYTGAGVFNFDDADYGYGKKLPAAVPAETIAAMLKSGKASHKAPNEAKSTAPDESGALRDKVQALTVERDAASLAASDASVEIGRLQDELATVTGERDAAREALEQAQANIKELSEAHLGTDTTLQAPAAPAAPQAPAAGPKSK